jgi:putative nucleotidyltransferase with HDIG domain
MSDLPLIEVNRLRPGIFIHLDLGWMDHPFITNKFQIKDEEQIATIRSLGLKQVRYVAAKSTVLPLPPQSQEQAAPVNQNKPDAAISEAISAEIAAKQVRVEKSNEIKRRIRSAETTFVRAATAIKDIQGGMSTNPRKAHESAKELIGTVVASLVADEDIALHLMADKAASDDVYYHSLNVTLLSLMLGRALKLPADDLKTIGVGALLHDIGKAEIPGRVLLKKEALNNAEMEVLKTHVRIGVSMGKTMGVSVPVLQVIAAHHEFLDGTGYPSGLKEAQIPMTARIVCLANAYDEMCNHLDITKSITPHEALSILFAKQRARFDGGVLQGLIKLLGVYPPGTVVRLSNDMLGMVMSINTSNPTRPGVMLYDADVPKESAITLDLGTEPDISISKALRPSQLAGPVYEYLSPRKRVNYYFDSESGIKAQGR